jgi:hypothetical protein
MLDHEDGVRTYIRNVDNIAHNHTAQQHKNIINIITAKVSKFNLCVMEQLSR